MIRFEHIDSVTIRLPRAAMLAVFDECDRYNHDETGGRIIGTYKYAKEKIHIRVCGVIGPGPNARRTATSFFQDGDHQERVFRTVEADIPEIEHLGNWHTHHVNGYPQLSGGDVATYRRTVNHASHNTTFFYALLVVAKRPHGASHERYDVKHYLLRRDDAMLYQIPNDRVSIVDDEIVWPLRSVSSPDAGPADPGQRFFDQKLITDTYHGLRLYTSEQLGLYWRGRLELIDGSHVELIVTEQTEPGSISYAAVLRRSTSALHDVAERLKTVEFSSARAAVREVERSCNLTLYDNLRRSNGRQEND